MVALMEERDWKIIDTLYREKSISRTAKALYISQPALTARIHQIEQDLGCILAIRTSKGVKFTPQGELVAQKARVFLREFDQVREELQALSDGISGTLRIAASQFMMKYVLPDLLGKFKEQYPAVDVTLASGWSRDIYGIVRCGDAHVGFVLDTLEWEEERYLLFSDPMCIVSTSEIRMDELPDMPRIEFRTNPSNKAVLDRWWQNRFDRPPRIAMVVDILDTCHEMVRHGLGYALLPKMIVEHDPLLHIEELRDQDGQPILRSGWMVYSNKIRELLVVEHFIDFVKSSEIGER